MLLIVVLIVFLAAAGAISSRSMAEFSGFYESPGPPSSGDVLGISLAHRNGYRNDPRRKCIRSSPPPFLLGVIIAKDHVMVDLN